MYAEEMYRLGTNRSVIRDLFEYGNKRKAQIGAENVFDFSLGNPNVPAPESVKEVLADLIQKEDPVALTVIHLPREMPKCARPLQSM